MPIKNTCKRFKSGKGKGGGRGELTFYDESEVGSGQSPESAKARGQDTNEGQGPAHLRQAA